MSKNVSIEEGDRSRNFGPTSKIKTELQGGGECYWVPEDERLTAYVFASKNREYTADNISAYGIGEIDVNVIYAGVDPNGNPWYVYIDPNTGMPVIEYPEAKVTDFDIKFPSGIAAVGIGDDEYVLVEVDTGEQIRVDKITGEIITVDPQYEDTEGSYPINVDPVTGKPYVKDPETGEPFVDGDGNPINPVTGKPIEIEDIQTGDNPAGVTITINPDTGFPIVENPITGEPIAEIDEDLISDMGIDPTSDIDISMDDLGDIDMDDMGDIDIVGDIDGIPTVTDLDLDDMEWETEDCPASIKIMHVPNKTSYKDGEAIDLDGLVVESFDKDGNSLGYIPAHKLSLSQTSANYDDGKPQYEIPDYSEDVTSVTTIGNASETFDGTSERIREAAPDATLSGLGDVQNRLGQCDGTNVVIIFPHTPPDMPWGSAGVTGNYTIAFIFDPLPSTVIPGMSYPGTYLLVSYNWKNWGDDAWVRLYMSESRGSHILFCGEKDGAISTANMTRTGGNTNDILVDWTSPCFQDFSGSFTISVSADHGGSHHSGKF